MWQASDFFLWLKQGQIYFTLDKRVFLASKGLGLCALKGENHWLCNDVKSTAKTMKIFQQKNWLKIIN